MADDKALHELLSPVEVAGIIGGVARRVAGTDGRPTDSMLAVYKDRLTYTFILESEVASIHFDAKRRQIFFRGHNVRFMDLQPMHLAALQQLPDVLAGDREGRKLLKSYQETLASLLSDTSLR